MAKGEGEEVSRQARGEHGKSHVTQSEVMVWKKKAYCPLKCHQEADLDEHRQVAIISDSAKMTLTGAVENISQHGMC